MGEFMDVENRLRRNGRPGNEGIELPSSMTKYLGVSRSTLYQLIEFGEIRAVKSKRVTLIEKESLDDFRAIGKLT